MTNTPANIIKTKFVVDPLLDVGGFLQIKDFLYLKPDDSFSVLKDEVVVKERVLDYHKKHAGELEEFTKQVGTLWQAKESIFSELAGKLFKIDDVTEQEYTCYPSIWPLIARDPMKLRVAFPAQAEAEAAVYVLAHEFLHELFYRHVSSMAEGYDLNSKVVFDVSEVLNVLVLSSPEWQKEFPFEVKPYPEHQELLEKLTPIWQEKNNIDEFINEALRIETK